MQFCSGQTLVLPTVSLPSARPPRLAQVLDVPLFAYLLGVSAFKSNSFISNAVMMKGTWTRESGGGFNVKRKS